MIFSMEIRRARKGDCFLLHYGTKGNPGLAIIDGGPKSVYKPHLKPRLEKLAAARQAPLQVDLLMISHVDDDHIQGILDLSKEEIQRDDAQEPTLLNVLAFWHNCFDDVVGGSTEEIMAAMHEHFGEASLKGSGELPEAKKAVVLQHIDTIHPEEAESGLMVLASVAQGDRLRKDAERLGWPLNGDFGGGLIVSRDDGKAIGPSKGLSLTIVGPMLPEVKALRVEHQKWLKKLAKKAKSPEQALAAYLDPSVTNLSSIVVLAQIGNKRILLTGDARGDKILEGLKAQKLLDANGRIHVDILKVPHHGSANNLEENFFEKVTADHYVFSGNGEHGNPERESMEMLFAARGTHPFMIHLTYPVDEIDGERKKDWIKERKKQIAKRDSKETEKEKNKVEVRPEWSAEDHGLVAFFQSPRLAKGQTVTIVTDIASNIIDLADPFPL